MQIAEMQTKVLFVEDDERLAELTSAYLVSSGLIVTRVATGPAGVAEALNRRYDVVLLDLMLPGCDGMDVCRSLRAHIDTPIIMLTARKDEIDRVLGFDCGADDYVTKPFSSRELVSRIQAVVRRTRGLVGPRQKLLQVGDITLDPTRMRATLSGRELDLTGYEFTLLRVFAERPGRVLSREQLMDLAKGSAEEAFDRSIDVRISRLRQKLGEDARSPRYLKTIRGRGYMLASR